MDPTSLQLLQQQLQLQRRRQEQLQSGGQYQPPSLGNAVCNFLETGSVSPRFVATLPIPVAQEQVQWHSQQQSGKAQKRKSNKKQKQPVEKKKRKPKNRCQKPDCYELHSGKCSDGSRFCGKHREEHEKKKDPDFQPQAPWVKPTCAQCGNDPVPDKDGLLLCTKHRKEDNKNRKRKQRAKKLVEEAVQVLHIEQVMKNADERKDRLKKFKELDPTVGTYSPGDDPLPTLPNHGFGKIQYYDDTTLQAMMKDAKMPSHIHCLGGGEYGALRTQSHDYVENDFIAEIATSSRKLVLEHKQLSVELTKAAKRNCKHLEIEGDSAPAFNRAAEVHLGEHTEKIQFFKAHRDKKVFGMVTLYGLEGFSFNFVIVEGTVEGSNDNVEFDKGLGNYKEYDQWKTTLEQEDREGVELYEANLKSKNGDGYQKGFHTIIVYKLKAGQRLIFNAQGLTHGVIVPAWVPQADESKPRVKNERSVIVYHDLIPRWGDEPDDGCSDANTKATITSRGRKVRPPRRL
ncbi:expressed unknown protein [Seminavis robusta]|uniref:Uncharacterized protein n=1 Tax=Seminavis robusta TaxID=568900 RepID=A0A9N8EJW6_9STRA|nr:expressed unknown protein [Seminavis robusta]|eukprot:Sro1120_g243360.1 n/a (514) ;mRNA; f:30711-32252